MTPTRTHQARSLSSERSSHTARASGAWLWAPQRPQPCGVRSSKLGNCPKVSLCECVLPLGAALVVWALWNMGSRGQCPQTQGGSSCGVDFAHSLRLHLWAAPTCHTLVLPGKPCDGQKEDPGVLVPALCLHVAGTACGPRVRPSVGLSVDRSSVPREALRV